MGLEISRLWAEEMREFKRNCLIIAAAFSRFEFHAKFVKRSAKVGTFFQTTKSLDENLWRKCDFHGI